MKLIQSAKARQDLFDIVPTDADVLDPARTTDGISVDEATDKSDTEQRVLQMHYTFRAIGASRAKP